MVCRILGATEVNCNRCFLKITLSTFAKFKLMYFRNRRCFEAQQSAIDKALTVLCINTPILKLILPHCGSFSQICSHIHACTLSQGESMEYMLYMISLVFIFN